MPARPGAQLTTRALHDAMDQAWTGRTRVQVVLGHEHAVRMEWPIALRYQLDIMRDSPHLAAGVIGDCPYLTEIWAQDALLREGLLHVVPG